MSGANVSCPEADCGGEFEETTEPGVYECQRCGHKLRESVVDRLDSFKRIADSDTPLAEVAEAALEGVDGE